MSYCRQISQPVKEPVYLYEAKMFCKVTNTAEDWLITTLISSARQYAETWTNRALAQRQFVLVIDSLPYYTNGALSQFSQAFGLPRYATGPNYAQMIKLPFSPVKSVDSLRYIGTDGNPVTLHADTDFIVDRISEPCRIFPLPGSYWPADLYVANSAEITFTAGYDPDPNAAVDTHTVVATPPGQQPDSNLVLAVPQTIRTAILMLVAHWYSNREPVASGAVGSVPHHVSELLHGSAVTDFYPTRG
jgi:hypothetical protein